MGLLLEKKETKEEVIYKVKPKPWYITGLIALFLYFGTAFNRDPKIVSIGIFVIFIWFIFMTIEFFPVWWTYIRGNKTIIREGTGFLAHNRLWRIKK